jgi:Tetratricopeptide repeat
VERLEEELQQVDQKVAVTGKRLGGRLVLVAILVAAALGAVGFVILQQQAAQRALQEARAKQEIEQRAQQEERAKQDRERIAAEIARQQARKIEQIEREFAERFLQQLLTNKEIKAEDARQRALKELPALVKLPLAEIESLINRKIAPPVAGAAPSPVDMARAALAKGDLDGVFKEADKEKQQGREMAMLEGTAALAKFRGSPKPEWNTRALAAFYRAMALADPNSDTEWEAWTKAAVSAASVLYDLARYSEAEPLLRDCLRLRESRNGPNSPGVSEVLNNLAQFLMVTKRLAQVEPLMRRALAIDERTYGPDHPDVANRLNNLAGLLEATNRMAEAEPLMRRALAIFERLYGPDNPSVAIRLNNLALLLQATNRKVEAEPLMARAVRILSRFQQSTGHEHPDLRAVVSNYRQLLALQKLAEPEIAARIKVASGGTEKLSPMVPEVERRLGPAKPVAEVLSSLDRQYREQGKQAVYLLGPNEPIAPHLDELLRPNGDGLAAMGLDAFLGGAHADAVVLFEAALELMADKAAKVPAKLRTQMSRASALRELGMVEQSREELSRLLPELAKMRAADALVNGRARYHLALCQWRQGEQAAAQRSAEESLTAYDRAPKAEPVDPDIRRQSEELLAALKDGKVPPPLAAIDGKAAIEVARARYRAREALTKLGLKQESAPLLDQVLGPAKPTKEVFDALDRQYREQGKPSVWFLPLNEPIAPHLDELLGKPSG